MKVWVCCCEWWYTGEGDINIYTTKPGKYQCHEWDCGWREVQVPKLDSELV